MTWHNDKQRHMLASRGIYTKDLPQQIGKREIKVKYIGFWYNIPNGNQWIFYRKSKNNNLYSTGNIFVNGNNALTYITKNGNTTTLSFYNKKRAIEIANMIMSEYGWKEPTQQEFKIILRQLGFGWEEY